MRIEVSDNEGILLCQLVQQHMLAAYQDPSKAHLLAEGNTQRADGDFSSQLLRKLLAAREASFKVGV